MKWHVVDHHDWDIGMSKVYTMSNCLRCTTSGMYVNDVLAYTIVDIEAIEAIWILIYEMQLLTAIVGYDCKYCTRGGQTIHSTNHMPQMVGNKPPLEAKNMASLNICIFYIAPTKVHFYTPICRFSQFVL